MRYELYYWPLTPGRGENWSPPRLGGGRTDYVDVARLPEGEGGAAGHAVPERRHVEKLRRSRRRS